jgi:BRO family, N-terminal domain
VTSLKLFENKHVRSEWDAERQAWYFSIVDVVAVLTDSPNPRKYWSVLKTRLKKEGGQLATNCSQLKMRSADGKNYLTDVADTEQLLRLIQSMPSPKAEPFKQWLARVGYERIEETEDPELALDRAMETYLKKGYSDDPETGEVHSFPQEPTTTRGNTHDRPRKNPNSDELGFGYWWCRGDWFRIHSPNA